MLLGKVEVHASPEAQEINKPAEHLMVLRNMNNLVVCQHILAWSYELKARALTIWRLWMEHEQHVEADH